MERSPIFYGNNWFFIISIIYWQIKRREAGMWQLTAYLFQVWYFSGREGTMEHLLNYSLKFYNNVFSFVDLTTLGTVVNFDWLVNKVVHQYIGHCLISLILRYISLGSLIYRTLLQIFPFPSFYIYQTFENYMTIYNTKQNYVCLFVRLSEA